MRNNRQRTAARLGQARKKFSRGLADQRADYLITGNQRHFPAFWKKTKVVTSREFIRIAAPHLLS
jgi:hypothetical protein